MTDSAPDLFASWLSADIRPALSQLGFKKTQSNFHVRGQAAWGVINFQKSQFGSRLETKFTINLGVALDRLMAGRGDDPGKKPPEYRCEWRSRIAEAVGDPVDRWWTLDHETDLARLTAEIAPLLTDRAVPLITERLTEDGFVAALNASPRVGHVAFFTDAQIVTLLADPARTS